MPADWFIDAASDLLIGGSCFGCDRPGRSLCLDCAHLLTPEVNQVHRAGLAIPVFSAGRYSGVLQKLLPAYKDDQALQLAAQLGRLLAAAISQASAEPLPLVPVPSSKKAVRQRGYAHVETLVRHARKWLAPAPKQLKILRSVITADQVDMTRSDRFSNVAKTMSARPGKAEVLICDDIVTTGATLTEAVRALTCAGYQVRAAAVIADTVAK